MVERYKFYRKLWYGRKSIVFFFCLLFTSLSLYAQEGTLHYGYLKLDGVEMKAGYNDGEIANGSLVFTENADGTLTLTNILGNSLTDAFENSEVYGKTKEVFIEEWIDYNQYEEKYQVSYDDYYFFKYNGQYNGRYSVAHHNDVAYWSSIEHVVMDQYDGDLSTIVIDDNNEKRISPLRDIYIEDLQVKIAEPATGGFFVDTTTVANPFNDDYYSVNAWHYRGQPKNSSYLAYYFLDRYFDHNYDDDWKGWDNDMGAFVVATGTEGIPMEYYVQMSSSEAREYINSLIQAQLEADAEAAWEEALAELQDLLDAGGSDLIAYHDALASATTIEFPSEVDGMTVTAIDLNTDIYTSFDDGGNNLTTIILPTTLTSITNFGYIFNNECFDSPVITNINLDQLTSLEKVGDYGLAYFSNYQAVLSLTTIKEYGEYAFEDTPLTITNLDLTDASLRESTFNYYITIQEAHFKNTTNLDSSNGILLAAGTWNDVYIEDDTMQDPSIFFGSETDPNGYSALSSVRIIVPDGLYDDYINNSVWGTIADQIKMASEVVPTDFGDVTPAGFANVDVSGNIHYADFLGYRGVLRFRENQDGTLTFVGIGNPLPSDEKKEELWQEYQTDHLQTFEEYFEVESADELVGFKLTASGSDPFAADRFYTTNNEGTTYYTYFNSSEAQDFIKKSGIKAALDGDIPAYCLVLKTRWNNYKSFQTESNALRNYYVPLTWETTVQCVKSRDDYENYPFRLRDIWFQHENYFTNLGVASGIPEVQALDNAYDEAYSSLMSQYYLEGTPPTGGFPNPFLRKSWIGMCNASVNGQEIVCDDDDLLVRKFGYVDSERGFSGLIYDGLSSEGSTSGRIGYWLDFPGTTGPTYGGQIQSHYESLPFKKISWPEHYESFDDDWYVETIDRHYADPWTEVSVSEVKQVWENMRDVENLYNFLNNYWPNYVDTSSEWLNDDVVLAFKEALRSAGSITIPSTVDGMTVTGVNWTSSVENLNAATTVNLPTSATKITAMPATTILPVVTTVNLSSMSNLREVGGFKNYSTLTGTYDLSQVKTYRNEAFSGCNNMRITKVDLKDGEVGMTPFVGVTVDELVYQNTKANGTNIRMLSGIKDCSIYIKEDSVMNANRFLAMEGDEYTLQSGCTVYVPCPLVTEYKAAAGWKDIANQIEAYGCDYYVIVDGEEEYEGVIYVDGSTPSTLELKKTSTKTGSTLEIPQSLTVNETTFTVTGIAGGGACKDRTDYTKVILPETVTKIGDDAFSGCSNVAEINLDNVTVYGANAMKGCSSLTIHADFHNVTSIGSGAFQNSGLQSVWLRTLGDAGEERSNVFGGCPNLLSIYLDQDDPTVVDPSHLGIVSGGKTAVFVSCTNVASAYTGSVKNPIEMYHLNDNWGKADYWNSVYPMLHQVGGVEQGRKFSTFCFDKPIDFTGKTIKNTEHCIEGMLQYYLQPENNTTGFIDNRIEPLVVTGYTYQGGVEPNAGGDVSDESGSLTVANPGPRPAYTGILVRWHHDDEFNNASGLQEFYPLPPVRDTNGYILYNQESFHTAYPEAKSGTFVHEGEVNSGARNKFHDGSYVDQDAAGTRSYNETSGVYTGEGFSNLLIGVTEKTDSIYYYPWFYAIATDGNGNEIVEGGKPVLDTNNKSFDTHYKQFMLNGDQKRFQRCARMTENERMSGSWLRPYRAYLRLPILADGKTTTDGAGGEGAAAPIKAYFYIDENNNGEATTISLKEFTEGLMPEGVVYNMSGLKVSDHGLDGLAPGLYIMNGKKVVKK